MTPRVQIIHGDCLDALATLPDNSIDAVVTDPPYGLEFMGKEWDKFGKTPSTGRGARVATERADEMTSANKGHSTSAGPYLAARVDSVRVAGKPFQQWCELWTAECLRVLKPGGHLLAFGGTRTWHRLACAVEDAGFEVRDSIAWLYGSGFPKSLDVSKAIDKAAGVEREVVGLKASNRPNVVGQRPGDSMGGGAYGERVETAPATEAAQQWQGWGTALKPAFEPIVVARKPLTGTVAANVLAHGTGALNIDGCRIGLPDGDRMHKGGSYVSGGVGVGNTETSARMATGTSRFRTTKTNESDRDESMANIPPALRQERGISDFPDNWRPSLEPGSIHQAEDQKLTSAAPAGRWPANVVLDEHQAAELDQQSGEQRDGVAVKRNRNGKPQGDSSWSLPGAPMPDAGFGGSGGASRFFYCAKAPKKERPVGEDGTAHPTVKPLALMRWLVRLVTPPGGVVLEPFAGSGATVEAAVLEGFDIFAIERDTTYLPLIEQRLARVDAERCELFPQPTVESAPVEPAPVELTREQQATVLAELAGPDVARGLAALQVASPDRHAKAVTALLDRHPKVYAALAAFVAA